MSSVSPTVWRAILAHSTLLLPLAPWQRAVAIVDGRFCGIALRHKAAAVGFDSLAPWHNVTRFSDDKEGGKEARHTAGAVLDAPRHRATLSKGSRRRSLMFPAHLEIAWSEKTGAGPDTIRCPSGIRTTLHLCVSGRRMLSFTWYNTHALYYAENAVFGVTAVLHDV